MGYPTPKDVKVYKVVVVQVKPQVARGIVIYLAPSKRPVYAPTISCIDPYF
jgi:hypothetical protein